VSSAFWARLKLRFDFAKEIHPMKIRIGCVVVGFLLLSLSLAAQTSGISPASAQVPPLVQLPAQAFTIRHLASTGGMSPAGLCPHCPPPVFTTLFNFGGTATEGANPQAALVQATNGNLYGTTVFGGAYGNGTVFEMTPGGTLTTIYSFSGGADGSQPQAELFQATNGNLYGTTFGGGNYGYGEVFEMTPTGTLTTIYSFGGGADGAYPFAGLVQATNGDFYGTTAYGGAYGYGTVFKMTPTGTLTTLHSFSETDGAHPQTTLVQDTNGNFYGTTYAFGTVFKITPSGTLTTLHSFSGGADGGSPNGLVQATNGNFYGTTFGGGANAFGTVFKITPSGTLTTLFAFDEKTNGGDPEAGLVQATDGNLYGTTAYGGANAFGTVFKITPGGRLTTLYSFSCPTSCGDGFGPTPEAPLVQDTNGNFYGTTYYGGANGDGTVFSLSVGLAPFVEFQFTNCEVGAAGRILGTALTAATGVMFSGTAADFKLYGSSLITTRVPSGATTGLVTVTTPGGTLASNKEFRVTPQITSFTPISGPVGTLVTITGVSLTQTTKVTFGGVIATSFTVDSDTQVTATVPPPLPGTAAGGTIAITTLGGWVRSSGAFTVTQ
jgi:uncharacterized repeat protein (TIGR03803 family)